MKRLLVVIAVLGGALGFSGTAQAAQPTIERFDIDDSFDAELLSDECGFPVTGVSEGHVIVRTFDDEDGLLQVLTINIGTTFSANGNDYAVRDVGADVLRVTPDGVVIDSIIGQVPFEFTGVLKVNLDTGEVILEPQHSTAEDLDEICQVLGG
jgi:hypothetical protein